MDWSDRDVWDFIQDAKVPMNPLYQEGRCRVGCIGCPMAGAEGQKLAFLRWPTYKDAYIRAFEKMLEMRRQKGLPTEWETGRDVFSWWLKEEVLPGQMDFEAEDLEV